MKRVLINRKMGRDKTNTSSLKNKNVLGVNLMTQSKHIYSVKLNEFGLKAMHKHANLLAIDSFLKSFTFIKKNYSPSILSLLLVAVFSILSLSSYSQSGISISDDSTKASHPSAILDVASNTQGVLIPRMKTKDRDRIIGPIANSLLIYNTTNARFEYFDSLANPSGIWKPIVGNNNWAVKGSDLFNRNIGNVGIGMDTPSEKLEVAGNTKLNGSLKINNAYTFPTSDGSSNQILTTDGKGNVNWVTFVKDSLDKISRASPIQDDLGNHIMTQPLQTNGNWLSGDGQEEGIFISNLGGDVGIGTATPSAKLEVLKTPAPLGAEVFKFGIGSGFTNLRMVSGKAIDKAFLHFGSTFNIAFSNSGGSINSNQSFTFNTGAGAAHFTAADGVGKLRLNALNGGPVQLGSFNLAGTIMHIGNMAGVIPMETHPQVTIFKRSSLVVIEHDSLNIHSKALNIKMKDSEKTLLVVKASGNVGVGTSTPTEKLEVEGDAKINGGLTLNSTTAGMVLPRLTEIQADVIVTNNTAIAGTILFVTDNTAGTTFTGVGFYGYNGITWKKLDM